MVYLKRKETINVLNIIFVLSISSWYILPMVHFTVPVFIIAPIATIFIAYKCLQNNLLRNEFVPFLFLYALLSLIYFLAPWPLNIKKAVLVFMEQLVMFYPYYIFRNIVNVSCNCERKYIFAGISIMFVFVMFSTMNEISNNPYIVRSLTSNVSEESSDIIYRMKNIGAFGFSYAVMFISIALVFFFKVINNSKYKVLCFLSVVLSFYFLIEAQFGGAIFLLILGIVGVFVKDKMKGNKAFVLAILIIPSIWLLGMCFYWLSSVLENEVLTKRLLAINDLLSGKPAFDEDITLRLNLLQIGFEMFMESPFIGNIIEENGFQYKILYSHSTYLDIACEGGMIALIVYFSTTFRHFKYILKQLKNKNTKNIYKILASIFIILGWFNPTWQTYEVGMVLFLYIPLMFNLKNRGDEINNGTG